MKLYASLERRSLLPALCPSTLAVRRVAPPSVSLQWQESALAQDLVAVSVPVASVSVPAAVLAAPVAALAPSARVAGVATGSVRVDLTVRGTEPAGKDETRTDATGVSNVRIDEIHVATSAALLDQRGIRVQGTTGFSAKHDMTAPKPNGGVRGIPPRGRPV
ncbi:hypothetical protein [Dactylosporangium sp. CA-139066]|uniref:hypothetical protein n=1 Tax=Dactylosporangium sp. CA-139066 TaxID=3239930 RepID=UPI003D8BF7B6